MSKSFKKLGAALNPVTALGSIGGSAGGLLNTTTLLGGLGLGSAIKNLTKVPGRRKPAPVVELPDEMETARKARNAAARKRRQGRASTVLSDFGYGA